MYKWQSIEFIFVENVHVHPLSLSYEAPAV